MLETTKTEMESLDKALETCIELGIRLDRLAKALQGDQKQEAMKLTEGVGMLTASFIDILSARVTSLMDKSEPVTSANQW